MKLIYRVYELIKATDPWSTPEAPFDYQIDFEVDLVKGKFLALQTYNDRLLVIRNQLTTRDFELKKTDGSFKISLIELQDDDNQKEYPLLGVAKQVRKNSKLFEKKILKNKI